MYTQNRAIFVSIALLVAFSGIARAGTGHQQRSQAAIIPAAQAILHKLPDQNIFGMAIPKPQRCDDLTCPGYTLIGIGF